MNFRLPKVNMELFSPANVNFKVLSKPRIVNNALKQATGTTRLAVISLIALTVASFIFTIFGAYLVVTKDIPDPKSEINEAVVMSFNHLNPLFTPKNSVEERLTAMIYTPLYLVEYNKFGTSNSANINTNFLIEKMSWSESKPQQNLTFRLKDNLTFSDGSKLSSADVKYTFDTIKALKNGNVSFKKNIEDLKLNVINDLEYEVVSEKPRTSMMYELDFPVVSKAYMSTVPIESLYESEQSKKPQVTSGTYKISQLQVMEKDYSDKKLVANPIANADSISFIRLDKFVSNNSKPQASTSSWFIKKYDSVLANNLSQKRISIETDAKLNKVDLFIREYEENPNQPDRPEEVKKALTLNKQELLENNWYLSAYFNVKPDISRSKPASKVEFRNFASCILAKSNYLSNFFNPIELDRKFTPISVNLPSSPDCSKNLSDTAYKVGEDGFATFNTADSNLTLKILYLGFDSDYEKHLIDIFQNRTNGKIRTEVQSLTSANAEVKDAFSSLDKLNKYDLIIKPTEINNLKLNPELIKSYTTLIGSNEDTVKLEELNTLYQDKNFNQKETEDLVKFFTEKSLVVNLYNYKTEINHNFRKPIVTTKNGQIGYDFSNWYNKTIKDWFFR
jgi:Bacterial extracellular solute-binding proteins, family 5 Middle